MYVCKCMRVLLAVKAHLHSSCVRIAPFSALPLGELFVNQFPCEALITCKDLLAQVALRVGGAGGDGWAGPEWLPLTFNLLYELPQMVKEYFERKER